MKKNIALILISISLVVSLNLYFSEKNKRIDFEEQMNEWKKVAESEQELPSLNKDAIDFVKALNNGKHKNYLTGEALNEYNVALGDENLELEGHEEHTDQSLQDVKILLSNTQLDKKKRASSKVLYQVHYTGIFDNPNIGVVDQRILTFVMTIDWKKEKQFKVNKYNLVLLEDTMGLELPPQLEGSVGNE